MQTIVIIGAGASGLACASTLSMLKTKANIIVLEQFSKTAKKLLATGNGRCNISNVDMDIKYYNKQVRNIYPMIASFDAVSYFKRLGMLVRQEGTLLYPFSNQASTVKKILLASMPNVTIMENCKALAIKKKNHKYIITTTMQDIEAEYIVVATGSKASKLSGEDNLQIIEDLGITTIPTKPSLVQLLTKPFYPSLKGVRVKAKVDLLDSNNTIIDSKKGEVLFNDKGVSGICVMQLSRWFYRYQKPLFLKIDMLPDFKDEEVIEILEKRKKQFGSVYMAGIFNEKLAHIIEKENSNPKNMRLEVVATNDYTKAQVMTGGVSLTEVTSHLECQKYPNIYVVGEVLDVDGDCGGYNLHFAFASGDFVAKNIHSKVNTNVTNK